LVFDVSNAVLPENNLGVCWDLIEDPSQIAEVIKEEDIVI
jgi:hypothetical protein